MSGLLPRQQAYARAATRYGADAVGTASPQRLLVLLYDRLSLDLARAQQAQRDGVREVAHQNLSHAQEIVAELLSTLDTTAWDGARDLARLYTWLLQQLTRANVRMDASITAGCIAVVEPLRDAWTQAANAQEATAPAQPGGGAASLSLGLTG